MSETMQERAAGAVETRVTQRSTAASRLEGLSATAARYLQQSARQLDAGQFEPAGQALQAALALAPNHPEVLRLQGVFACRTSRPHLALPLLQRALATWPDDALILGNLGSALATLGDSAGAITAFRRACALAPEQALGWFNLGLALENDAQHEEAGAALRRVLQLAPQHVPAHVAHAANLATLGRIDDAAAEYRHVVGFAPNAVRAWLGLTNLKTTRLDEGELALLERVYTSAALADEERTIAGFALGKALEDHARFDEAFAVFNAANAARRRHARWDARAFTRGVDDIAAAFAGVTPIEGERGHEVIFIVGLPRSGSTLIEQILGTHPEVEGASELPDLERVIREESVRRQAPFSAWASAATSDDWQRLGERYLARTARWRTQRPRHTDKMPDNWLLAGAALMMLPGARVIDCRRDRLEAAWSCYKQWFGSGRQLACYDLADIAAQMRDHECLMRAWHARFPQRVREQSHETLLADSESEVRALLDFCGLAFDPACLRFHESTRAVRSASAAQVRQPLRSASAHARDYGALLAPLRHWLEDDDSPAAASEQRSAITPASANAEPMNADTDLAPRLAGLAPEHQRGLARAIAALAQNRIGNAQAAIEAAHAAHPEHAETLHLLAALHGERGQTTEAFALLQRALDTRPGDASLLDTLGRLQAESGDLAAARQSFEHALERDPHAAGAHYKLAGLLLHDGDRAGARESLARVSASHPEFVAARIALADLLDGDGEAIAAAREYRAALHAEPASPRAWSGLVRVYRGALATAELDALSRVCADNAHSAAEQARLRVALATVLESHGRVREAFATLVAANAQKRRTLDWDGARFTAHCAGIAAAFASPTASADDAALGSGIVFLVDPAASGAEEIERLLAAHPHVTAGGELPDLAAVIADESRRRGRAFADWAAAATRADWQRLGMAYIERTQARRQDRAWLTDRAPALPSLLGAAAAMLPGARLIDCVRDPLEACWACFRDDREERRYGYDLIDLAGYWRANAHLMTLWRSQFGDRLRRHDPDFSARDANTAIRQLLADAGPGFDPACVDAHARQQAVQATLDAREAGLRHRMRASDYGDLLRPLQRALAIDAAAPAHVDVSA